MTVHLTNPICYNLLNHILPPVLTVTAWWEEPTWADGPGEGSPDVLFAYDALAASYNASKINLKTPGTYDLVPFADDPAWASPAWTFPYIGGSGTQLFMTGYTRPDLSFHWTVAVRAKLSTVIAFAHTAFFNAGNNDIIVFVNQYAGGLPVGAIDCFHFSVNPGVVLQNLDTNWHVYILSGWKLYMDGVLKQTITGGTYPYSTGAGQSSVLQLGGEVYSSAPYGYTNEISRFIGIDRELTPTEVTALTTAMNS